MGKRSNYPAGFSTGITVRGLPLSSVHPGEVFFVNNSTILAKGGVGGSDGANQAAGTYQRPFRTIDYAIGRCVAGRGDVIFVMPGHAETLNAAAFITMDVDGVALIGLGSSAGRPTLTYTTTANASISWTADNCSMQGFNLVGNVLSVAAAVLNSGGAGWTIENCWFRDTDATHGLLSCVTTTVSTNSDDGYFADNRRDSDATTTPGTAIKILNTTKGLKILRNEFWHSVVENNVPVIIQHNALVVTNLLIDNNTIYSINTAQTTNGLILDTSATTGSGVIRNNHIRSNDPSATIMTTPAAIQYGHFENYHTGEVTSLSGFLLPGIGGD